MTANFPSCAIQRVYYLHATHRGNVGGDLPATDSGSFLGFCFVLFSYLWRKKQGAVTPGSILCSRKLSLERQVLKTLRSLPGGFQSLINHACQPEEKAKHSKPCAG